MLILVMYVASGPKRRGAFLFNNLSVQSSNGKVDLPESELNLCSTSP
jgi:hypothetical protein